MRWNPEACPGPGAGPLVKWVGGKSALLPELRKRLPAQFRSYYEPFAGGAALFFWLAAALERDHAVVAGPRPTPTWAVLGDRNADLIATYACVRDQADAVYTRLLHYADRHARTRSSKRYPAPAFFYQVRERWNRPMSADVGTSDVARIDRASAFLYLNRTCWNGVWRVNRDGKFNVPAGRYKHPQIANAARIHACAQALAGAFIACGPWHHTVADADYGDVVYFDPPYVPLTATANFTSYTQEGFGADDQVALAEAAHALVRKGVHVIVSNSDTPIVRKLYKGMKISKVQMARSISCKGDRRQPVGELLIVGSRR